MIATGLSLLLLAPLALALVLGLLVGAPFLAAGSLLDRWRKRRLRARWERVHGRHGRRILFVYSESPHWHRYVQERLLPRVAPAAVPLNWSRRSELAAKNPLEWQVFAAFRPAEGFNPAALLLPETGEVRILSFWQAFRDYKHGKSRTLEAAEAELVRWAGDLRPPAA